MAIPQADSAALMEGMMLHKQGLVCVKRLRTTPIPAPAEVTAAAVAAVPSRTVGNDHQRAVVPPAEQQQQQADTPPPVSVSSGRREQQEVEISSQSSNASTQQGTGWEEAKMTEAVGCGTQGRDGGEAVKAGEVHGAEGERQAGVGGWKSDGANVGK